LTKIPESWLTSAFGRRVLPMHTSKAKVAAGLLTIGLLLEIGCGIPVGGGGKIDLKDAKAVTRLATGLLAVGLPAILERFRARRLELLEAGGGAGYPADGTADLLDTTERQVLAEFKGEDLVPIQDYVEDRFDDARRQLGLAATTAFDPPASSGMALASWRPAAGPPRSGRLLDRQQADPPLDGIDAFVSDLGSRKDSNEMAVRLCIVSQPEGAMVAIRSRAQKKPVRQRTNGMMSNVYRGVYLYKVSKRGSSTIDCEKDASNCAMLDVWSAKQPVLDCDLEEGSCRVDEGWSGDCRRP
jgi:hypothetical protein